MIWERISGCPWKGMAAFYDDDVFELRNAVKSRLHRW